jgi:uncharacterized membrane protein
LAKYNICQVKFGKLLELIWICQVNYAKLLDMNLTYLFRSWQNVRFAKFGKLLEMSISKSLLNFTWQILCFANF